MESYIKLKRVFRVSIILRVFYLHSSALFVSALLAEMSLSNSDIANMEDINSNKLLHK